MIMLVNKKMYTYTNVFFYIYITQDQEKRLGTGKKFCVLGIIKLNNSLINFNEYLN